MVRDEDIRQLREITSRIRSEAVSVLMINVGKRMLEAGIRRRVVEEVMRGAQKDSERDFDTIDDEMIRLALGDLWGAEGDPET